MLCNYYGAIVLCYVIINVNNAIMQNMEVGLWQTLCFFIVASIACREAPSLVGGMLCRYTIHGTRMSIITWMD